MRSLIYIFFLFSLSHCGIGIKHSSTSAPTITSASTTTNSDGTVTVTIGGSGFVTGTTVTISGVPCTNVIIVSDTQLKCTLPNGSIALVDIVVTSPGSGSSGSSGVYHTIFVTSTHSGGDLSGAGGADTICQTQATAGSKTASLTGTWRAIISTDSVNAKDRISFVSGSGIKNTNSEIVLSSSSNIWSGGNLSAPLKYDENGAAISDVERVWTGTNTDGTKVTLGADSSERNCVGWSTNSLNKDGYPGDPMSTSTSWIYTGVGQECRSIGAGNRARLYCINSNN